MVIPELERMAELLQDEEPGAPTVETIANDPASPEPTTSAAVAGPETASPTGFDSPAPVLRPWAWSATIRTDEEW